MTLIELDDRKRVSLGKYATGTRYLLTTEPDGTLILTPAVALSVAEARLLDRPDLLETVKNNRADGFPGRSDRPRLERRRGVAG